MGMLTLNEVHPISIIIIIVLTINSGIIVHVHRVLLCMQLQLLQDTCSKITPWIYHSTIMIILWFVALSMGACCKTTLSSILFSLIVIMVIIIMTLLFIIRISCSQVKVHYWQWRKSCSALLKSCLARRLQKSLWKLPWPSLKKETKN